MRTLFAREEGIALPTAIMVLTLCLMLTAVVAEGADQLSGTSGADQRGKRALAAADAGVDVAIRRLRSLPKLDDTHCLTTPPTPTSTQVPGVPPSGTPAVCPGSPWESVGDGAEFSYVVEPVTVGSSTCYQVPGQTIPATHLRRCITSTGRVGTEVRRVQTQVIVPRRTPGQWMGILGLDSVMIRNSARTSSCFNDEVPGPTIGSNSSVTIANSGTLNYQCPTRTWAVEMPAGQTPSIHPQAQPAGAIPVTTAPAPYTILPPPRSFESVAAPGGNNNDRMSNVTPDGPYVWNATQRTLRVTNGNSLRLNQGGDYIFCSLTLDNSATLDFSTTEKTRIWIDSPSRPGSSCGASGFIAGNGARINWPATVADTNIAELSARALNLEVYVYAGDLQFNNSARFAGLLQAERSAVQFINGSQTIGAVAAKSVTLDNSGNFQRPVGLLGWGPDGPPWRSAGWTQCRSIAAPASTPRAGC